ncbi:hypothetical protein SUGI_0204500 [Cryptomeria japonica]|uniref:gibberellin-regulated protein 5-like n=1 Tax=Cryptomeria japonica TaxID=3369 RepID=UPI002408AAAD|nr:gibberellin-regulated protein 5-like [Cryptomeria japonica]GLJ13067.1 hypothetical protein SUGI_0204500 [Cryptomeria japonica]
MARFTSYALLLILLIAFFVSTIEADLQFSNDDSPSIGLLRMNKHGHGKLKPSECHLKCAERCSATSHRKPCMFFCQKCCAKCLCVPPGTYGNKEVCSCYNNWKTKEGGPKCP